MSATIWTEVETGVDRGPAPRRRGYWSGNQGCPVRRPTGGRRREGVVGHAELTVAPVAPGAATS